MKEDREGREGGENEKVLRLVYGTKPYQTEPLLKIFGVIKGGVHEPLASKTATGFRKFRKRCLEIIEKPMEIIEKTTDINEKHSETIEKHMEITEKH